VENIKAADQQAKSAAAGSPAKTAAEEWAVAGKTEGNRSSYTSKF